MKFLRLNNTKSYNRGTNYFRRTKEVINPYNQEFTEVAQNPTHDPTFGGSALFAHLFVFLLTFLVLLATESHSLLSSS